MKLQTEKTENGYILEITGIYVPAERGSRDKYGVPLEPDYNAYFEITDVRIDGKSYDEYELADLLGYSVEYTCEMLQEALQAEYDYQYESYQEMRAEAYFDDLREREYDYF